jgi:DNA gyrase subunit A
MRLQAADDQIVALEAVVPNAMLLTVSETGLGKRTDFEEYPKHSRGGQGVVTHNVTARTGRVVAARTVMPDYELMVVSQSGIVMRTTVDSIAKVGRSAQGVHVMNVGANDGVAGVEVVDLSKAPPAMINNDPAADLTVGTDGGDGAAGNGSGNGRSPRGGRGRKK